MVSLKLLCCVAALITVAPSHPGYRWRGVSLDVARHFFPPQTIRRFIDLAAHYHLSVVHLHLTDNEAWRLPSRRYPRLPSAQHYTQAQLRDLSVYARRRGITIVPEIDLPAHAAAAIRAYPNLACGARDTLCPSAAVPFARNVLDEALQIFSSPYVHTGGDEVEGWTAQQRTAFERAMNGTIRRAHRTMVVWDDESDAAPPGVIVEVWHLGDAASRAMRRGHDVVIASDGPLYFDAVQGDASQEPRGSPYMTTLEEVYAFSPPAHAFGVEGVVWSEHIASERQLWYMLLPREIALSAVAAYGRRKMPWPAFRDRVLPRELAWLQDRGYAFRVPNTDISIHNSRAIYAGVPGNANAAIAYTRERRVRVILRTVLPRGAMFYRTNAHTAWQRYRAPFFVDAASGTTVQAKTLSSDGRAGAVTMLIVRQGTPASGSRTFENIVSP